MVYGMLLSNASYQTKVQLKFYLKVKKELDKRISNGDLRIIYFQDISVIREKTE